MVVPGKATNIIQYADDHCSWGITKSCNTFAHGTLHREYGNHVGEEKQRQPFEDGRQSAVGHEDLQQHREQPKNTA